VSTRFFSLIKNGAIHIAPSTKILPKEEIEQLLNGKEALDKILEDAEQYRFQVAQDCEKLKENAQKEGYEEGFKSWLEHVAKLEEEIINVRKEYEKILIPVALKAAKKIVGREIEQSEKAILDIVSVALKPVASHKKIVIYVSKKDFNILEENKPKLKDLFENLETFALRERADIAPGGCIIETEGGIINAQLENQWRTLEKAFDQLTKVKEKHALE
jgi:type III secretion protein L